MKNEEMALLFSEATPYIQKYHGKTLVIKYGGNAMVNEELKLAVMNDPQVTLNWNQGKELFDTMLHNTRAYLPKEWNA